MIRVYIRRNQNQLGLRPIEVEPIETGGGYPVETFPAQPIETIVPMQTPAPVVTTSSTQPISTAQPTAPGATTTPTVPQTPADSPITTGAAESVDWIEWGKQNPLIVIAGVGAIAFAANLLLK